MPLSSADLGFEVEGAAPAKSSGEAAFRADPLVKGFDAKRLAEEAKPWRALEDTGGAGPVKTSTVIPGSTVGAAPKTLTSADLGFETDTPKPKESSPSTELKDIYSSMQEHFGEPLEGPSSARSSLDSERFAFAREPTPRRAFGSNEGGAATSLLAPKGKAQRFGPATAWPVGAAAQLSDMTTSVGKQLLGAAVYWGARVATKDEPESAKAAAEAKDYFFPDTLSRPWGKVAESLGPEATTAYYNNPIAFIFGKMGEAAAKGSSSLAKQDTTGRLQKEDIDALVDQTMGSLLAKGLKRQVKDAWEARKDRQDKTAEPTPKIEPTGPRAEGPFSGGAPKAKSGEWMPPEETGRSVVPQGNPERIINEPLEQSQRTVQQLESPRSPVDGEGSKANVPLLPNLGESPLKGSAQALLRAPDTERNLLPKQRVDILKEATGQVEGTGKEVAQLRQEVEELQQMSGAGSSAKTQAADAKLKAAEERLRNWETVKQLAEGLPDWAKGLGIGAAAYAGAKMQGQDSLDSLLLGAAALAVKGKGGMWHPKAADVLADPMIGPLTKNSSGFAPRDLFLADHELLKMDSADTEALQQNLKALNQDRAAATWAKKSSQSYLNKHMGTETDPLSGYVEVPKLQAEKKNLLAYVEQHKQRKVPALERKLGQDGLMEPLEKSQARLAAKQRDYTEAAERAQEAQGRIGQIDTALTKVKDGIAYDAASEIEIPFGEGTKKWGEVTDKLVASAPAKNFQSWRGHQDVAWAEHIPPEEKVHLLQGQLIAPAEASALKAYLSHVGDYLRQNVDSAKLSQYDLVRAVKETAKADAELAKKMEKEAADSGKYLPVHKEYPDGFKWVELKLPERLEGEQVRQVRPTQYGEMTQERAPRGWHQGEEVIDKQGYVAVDAAGKPIKNSYTESLATANTLEEAWLAGQLAREGNQMGHCVGGYCEGVAAGESRIFSLRDPKGRSHVTVEVEPTMGRSIGAFEERGPEYKRVAAEFLEQRKVGIHKEFFDKWLRKNYPQLQQDNITQIKGKQNRAPSSDYLPYVQDFVKSGKWGEVGDLENTGLKPFNQLVDAEQHVAKVLFPEEKFFTEKQLDHIYEPVKQALSDDTLKPGDIKSRVDQILARGPGGRQVGATDPGYLARLAAVGLGTAAGAALDPNNPFQGAVIGLFAGAALTKISPRRMVEAYKDIIKPGKIVRLDDLSRQTQAAKLAVGRAAWQVENTVIDLVPKESRRIAITKALDTGDYSALSPKERQAAGILRQSFNTVGQKGLEGGVLDDMIEHYVTHLYGQKGKSWWDQDRGAGTSEKTPYSKRRKGPPTLEEAKAAGLTPLTEDAAAIYGIYANSVGRALENKKFVTSLKAATDGSGQKLVVPMADPAEGYVTINHPQMMGLKVHPDIAPDLRFIFDTNDPNVIVRGLDALSTTQKRVAVAFSLFHAKSLLDATAGASAFLKTPGMVARNVAQSLLPQVFGRNKFLQQLREGGAGDLIDNSFKDGLNFSLERTTPSIEEQAAGFYPMLKSAQKFLDSTVPKLGLPVKGVEVLNHKFDSFMWGRLHAGLKLELYAQKVNELTKNNAAAHEANPTKNPLKTEREIGGIAASFANDIYGGLNWLRLMQEAQTRWGRAFASAALSPSGRQALRILTFAPDWTISTTRAFIQAFGKGSGPIRGIIKPQELADLHRQYILRSAVFYSLIADVINYQLSGHHFWENKDPTRVDMGDGRTMQLSKHFMEPIHWILNPFQQALNKLGVVPKEAMNQALGTEYLSAKGKSPPMKGGRVAHLARQFAPISSSNDDPGAAVSGFLGAPIYGKTRQQREREKAQRELLKRRQGK